MIKLICCLPYTDHWPIYSLADFAPDELEVGLREYILKDLETFVRRQFAGEVHHHLLYIFIHKLA